MPPRRTAASIFSGVMAQGRGGAGPSSSSSSSSSSSRSTAARPSGAGGADGSDGRASLRVACAIADRRASTQRSRSAGDRAWSRMVCCFSAQRTWRGTRSGLFLAKKKRDAAFRTLKGA